MIGLTSKKQLLRMSSLAFPVMVTPMHGWLPSNPSLPELTLVEKKSTSHQCAYDKSSQGNSNHFYLMVLELMLANKKVMAPPHARMESTTEV